MAAPDSGAGHRRCFAYSSHFHTEMMSLKKNGYAMGVKHGFQCIRNLLTDPLLYRKALGKEPHEAGQLGDADDVLMSNVTNISLAVKWKGVVFTKRKKGDGSLYNLAEATVRFAPAFRVEDSQQFWVAIIAFRRIKKCLNESPRCIF